MEITNGFPSFSVVSCQRALTLAELSRFNRAVGDYRGYGSAQAIDLAWARCGAAAKTAVVPTKGIFLAGDL
jgi:hypothetical protein